MSRALLLVLDSLGVGGAPDAEAFGDAGADTLGHIADHCNLRVPHLASLGIGEACRVASGRVPRGLEIDRWMHGHAGSAAEVSTGKDSQSGHWEIAGTPVEFEWGYFPPLQPCFPLELTQALCERGGLDGILGNRHASGTEIIAELGEQHVRTGQPICYTSADSVFQIAAHEEHFGLQRLYELCAIARELVDPLRIGRVIARPFVGEQAPYHRTTNRRDYGVLPPQATLLHRAQAARREIVSVGKIGDLFCHDATGREHKTHDNGEVFEHTLDAARHVEEGGLVLANFVDFDTLYGHRRDVAGYAAALEEFDARLPELLGVLREDDLVVITGDHGCDPTWRGTDHTRECIPVLAFGRHLPRRSLGRRDTFADIGQTLASHLRLPRGQHGTAF